MIVWRQLQSWGDLHG